MPAPLLYQTKKKKNDVQRISTLPGPVWYHAMWSHVPTTQASANLLAPFQGNGHEWSTPRRCHCSHIWTWMLDDVCKNLSFTFLLISFFSCGALLQYLVYLVLTVCILFRVIITTATILLQLFFQFSITVFPFSQ